MQQLTLENGDGSVSGKVSASGDLTVGFMRIRHSNASLLCSVYLGKLLLKL